MARFLDTADQSAEFVVSFFSRSLALKSSTFWSENITIFLSDDDFFTQYLFFNNKKESLDDFFMTTWEWENERKM